MMEKQLKKNDLVYPELSYKIIGILFDVYNEIGPGYREKHYEKAVCSELGRAGITYTSQIHVPVMLRGEKLGKDFLDIVVENKIVIELKKGDRVSKQAVMQIYEYLRATNMKLSIIARFGFKELTFKRIVNIV